LGVHPTEIAFDIASTELALAALDGQRHAVGANAETSAASNYALHAPAEDVTRPVGEWDRARIVVSDVHVEHRMNEVGLLEYELWRDEWREMVATMKSVDWPGYGMARAGHIGLQDHGDSVWYRNTKIQTY